MSLLAFTVRTLQSLSTGTISASVPKLLKDSNQPLCGALPAQTGKMFILLDLSTPCRLQTIVFKNHLSASVQHRMTCIESLPWVGLSCIPLVFSCSLLLSATLLLYGDVNHEIDFLPSMLELLHTGTSSVHRQLAPITCKQTFLY
jgi:hypothetical protein